jgi:hypothetical protein
VLTSSVTAARIFGILFAAKEIQCLSRTPRYRNPPGDSRPARRPFHSPGSRQILRAMYPCHPIGIPHVRETPVSFFDRKSGVISAQSDPRLRDRAFPPRVEDFIGLRNHPQSAASAQHGRPSSAFPANAFSPQEFYT